MRTGRNCNEENIDVITIPLVADFISIDLPCLAWSSSTHMHGGLRTCHLITVVVFNSCIIFVVTLGICGLDSYKDQSSFQ